jgi:hypothetical protein
MSAAIVSALLRTPGDIARKCRDEEDLRAITATSLAAVACGAAVYGAIVGSFRGDAQIAMSAVKLPLVLFGTLIVCVPAFYAIAALLGRPWPMRTVLSLVLASAGRAALVLLALSPILWLFVDGGLGYHATVLAATSVYGAAGLASLGVLWRGLGGAPAGLLTAVAFFLVLAAVGGQVAWSMRPYLGRPAQEDVPFVRAREGSFVDAVLVSIPSAAGIYLDAREPEAAPPNAPPPNAPPPNAPPPNAPPPNTPPPNAPPPNAPERDVRWETRAP